jgi:parvulin-like peptidyl-prolyl isomerase
VPHVQSDVGSTDRRTIQNWSVDLKRSMSDLAMTESYYRVVNKGSCRLFYTTIYSHRHSTFIISITMSQVRAAHLLIKHTGSRNPVSRRTGAEVTMAPADAMAELKEYEARILQEGIDASFPKYAKERSDCSSFRQNGDLGHFGRGDMQKPFEDATFALQPGQMSGIVSTDSGYHLIYRLE